MCTRDTFIRLYADKTIGILTEKRFWKLTDAMKKEQEINQNRMLEIAALISKEEHAEGNVFMETRRYAVITELGDTVFNRLMLASAEGRKINTNKKGTSLILKRL